MWLLSKAMTGWDATQPKHQFILDMLNNLCLFKKLTIDQWRRWYAWLAAPITTFAQTCAILLLANRLAPRLCTQWLAFAGVSSMTNLTAGIIDTWKLIYHFWSWWWGPHSLCSSYFSELCKWLRGMLEGDLQTCAPTNFYLWDGEASDSVKHVLPQRAGNFLRIFRSVAQLREYHMSYIKPKKPLLGMST